MCYGGGDKKEGYLYYGGLDKEVWYAIEGLTKREFTLLRVKQGGMVCYGGLNEDGGVVMYVVQGDMAWRRFHKTGHFHKIQI